MALLVLFFLALIPSLAESISSLAANMGSYVGSSQELLAELDQLAAKFRIDITEITDSISDALNSVMGNVPALLNRILSASVNMGSALFNIGIGFILAVYFLRGKSGILRAIEKLRRAALTEETYERHSTFLARCHRILIRYIGCNIFDAMIIGTINAVFMLLTGMEYIALISLVVGVTNLLPTFGPIIGGAIGAFILVLIDPMHALIFIVFTLVLQTFDGYILKPKLFGESLVIVNDALKPFVRNVIKQRGGMLAKGRLLGVQFEALFRDELWLETARHANAMAQKLTEGLKSMGVALYMESPTNQVFPIFPNRTVEALRKGFAFDFIAPAENDRSVIRFCTSWATPEENVDFQLCAIRAQLAKQK